MPIGYEDILAARQRIAGGVGRTPLQPTASLTAVAGYPIHLKLEHRQTTGSFKLRGATNAVLSLTDAERARGIVAASTGNHGRGVAYAARAAGARCVVCMSALVPQNKVEGIKALGAEVRIVGRSQDEAEVEAERLADEGMVSIPPFDHPAVIAGQGTLGVEIMEQCPEATAVIVPLSGGGLISGVARAVKSRSPATRVIGVTMERGAAMIESLKAGHPVPVEELPTLADSLGGGIGLKNAHTFAMVRELVNQTVLVSEAEIAGAIRHAYWKESEIVEGSGSVGIAAILAGKVALDGPAVVVTSGKNIDMDLHFRLISGETVDL